MKILYYLTAHGYGHAVRSWAIVNEFSPDVQVIFRTLIPERFFREEVQRPFEYFPEQFDCGCIQSDSVTVHKKETLEAYASLARENDGRLDEEVEWCRRQGVDGILSDIPPLAFEVARRAGLPSVAVTNFTWYDIYEPYARDFPYQDLIASVEVMISKIGYGVFSECLLNGTPLVYLPPEDFAS